MQSNRIASLETEITKLLSENIHLRTQVIQLTHRQDLSTQKAQLEKKLREIHRLVKSLGSASASTTQSPVVSIIRKSPKKTNLLNLSPEHSPERATPDFISTRSKPRSLAAPSRVARSEEAMRADVEREQEYVPAASPISDARASEPLADRESQAATPDLTFPGRDRKRESLGLEHERDSRRSSRRMSRTSDEMLPRPDFQTLLTAPKNGSPRQEYGRESTPVEVTERSSRRRSRSSMSFDSAPLYASTIEAVSENKRTARPTRSQLLNDDKENEASQRKSTVSIKFLHSSPVKSRTALNIIADPLPSLNIQATARTPAKPLNEVLEVKSELASPLFDLNVVDRDRDDRQGSDLETGGRSRRAKTVNYAEPSLRHKMRRTEPMPGDKRRKSSYRRTSSSLLDDRRISSSSSAITDAHPTITIEED